MDAGLTRGRATPEGTRRFAARFPDRPGHFRCPDRLEVASLGLGMRSGEAFGADDLLYRSAVPQVLQGGVNLFDTALSERMQMSERNLGTALERAFREGDARRDEVVVVTKGGFLTVDPDLVERRADVRRYLVETYIHTTFYNRPKFSQVIRILIIIFNKHRKNGGSQRFSLHIN